MIDDLRAMAIFAMVAETGSFSAAGRELKLATSGVSQHVSKLEDRLGVTLLYRSTRSLSLTSEGARLLEHARRMLAAAEEGLDSLVDIGSEPAGALTVTLPEILINSPYENAIWGFVDRYPAVNITVRYLDRNLDLVREGIDLALRMGSLPDSALRSRRLGGFDRVLLASPSYLDRAGGVSVPADLNRIDFVAMDGMPDRLSLTKGEIEETLTTIRGRVKVDNFAAVRTALIAGLGVQRLPRSVVAQDLQSGTLVELLPDWSIADLGIFGVWPDTSRRSSLTRMLVDYIAAAQ